MHCIFAPHFSEQLKEPFSNNALLNWYASVKRPLPWRDTKDPYLIWVSEIILQQTRVDQGLPYYERFVKEFPRVTDLANADEDEVLKLWEGLGYYSRARNMHFTARHIVNQLGGKFPQDQRELLSLKGIGPYTAAAIGSMAFSLKTAAVDGNVIRVISRVYGICDPVDSNDVKKKIDALADKILDQQLPSEHNQAMMELGATCCKPKKPNCYACPLNSICRANALNLQDTIPLKSKKTKVRDRFFYYTVYFAKGQTILTKRPSGDIWQGLYEFPMMETESRMVKSQLLASMNLPEDGVVKLISEEFKHILSHQRIFARFLIIQLKNLNNQKGKVVDLTRLEDYAMPRLLLDFRKKYPLVITEEV